MFRNSRYLTRGVQSEIPPALQLFLWNCIDNLPEPKDYFQVFELSQSGCLQTIHHFSEQPEYHMHYCISEKHPISAKVYVIDDTERSTLLLAEEY